MGFAEQLAKLTNSTNELITTVKGQFSKWDNAVKAEIGKMESWKRKVRTIRVIDLTNLDEDTFYPVLVGGAKLGTNLKVLRMHTEEKYPLGKMASVDLNVLLSGSSWGGIPLNVVILQNLQTYSQTVGAIGYMQHGQVLGLYLRGGYTYRIEVNHDFNFRILEKKTAYSFLGTENELTAGPVTLDECKASEGSIGSWQTLYDHGRKFINELGA